ncbi:hypothetical protein HPB48_016992 [Haemaphysalis longicornis]|uniref:BED-type domain-containing protein n=1 Tax=Haemaphysalis longicornis TaxID=44386 RepID=A0A9J6G775_HAELO|nr:hypothetical protein HPB48_016992 [Haemaphysalis longicornis]
MDESAQRALRSSIWDFFDRGASDATCRTCKMRLETPTATTTTLVNHLKRHPDAFENFEKLRAAEGAKKKATGPKTTTGTRATDANAASSSFFKPTLKGDAPRAKLLTKTVAQFIAAGLHSYSVVEEPGFLSLMHATVPEYKIPSRTFSRSVVPELYAKERE